MAQAETAAPAAPATSGAVAAIAICFLVAVLEGFDIQAIGLVNKALGAEIGLSPIQSGWVLAASNIGLVPGAALGGWLADRIGRKPVFILSVLTFGVFTFATAATSNYWPLLAVRFLTGFGFGAALPNIMAIAAEISRPDRRASTATMMFCGMPLGGAASAIFIANLPPNTDWRVIFYVGGTIPLVFALLIWLGLNETRRASARNEAKPMSTVKALFGEDRARSTLLLWITFFPTLMILYMLLNWLPALVADKGFAKPLDLVVGGLKIGVNASFTFNLASVAGALLLGQIIDRIGFRWPTILCYASVLCALIGLAKATALAPVLVYAGIAGFFILGAQYALYGVAASFYPAAIRGIGSGATTAIGRCGAIVGPLLAGELRQAGFSPERTILALAPAAVAAGIAVFMLSFRPQAKD
ncbi:MAG TPA: MFS transporter [Caulobacterales bacterium]|nr:MFS transporter [Caulobacterales bacterium]